MAICSVCGKKIKDKNVHYINGVAYGYNCYKQKLALIYKEWEDEKNKEYSIKCFSAMQIFTNKSSNNFHDSIVKQWNECKKLTAKQLECIIKGFSKMEMIDFYKVWFTVTEDKETKKFLSNFTIDNINKMRAWETYLNDDLIHDIVKFDVCGNVYKFGFYFYYDVDEPEIIIINQIGKDRRFLNETLKDEFYKVVKTIEK